MKLHGNNCAMNAEPEGERSVEQTIAKLGVMAELSERDRVAIGFAIRCAYALGKLEGEGKRRVG